MRLNKLYIFVMLMMLLSSDPGLGADNPPLDAVVVLDSSGSMKKTDPRELRKPAAKLFIKLLSERDRLSVMSFSDNAYPITYLTQLDSQSNRDRSLHATDKISSKGVYTNIYAALSRGIEILRQDKKPDRDAVIVLMSDGKMDVGDAQRSAQLKNKIREQLIPLLQQYKIKIYSVAFTEASEQNLLQELADATDGRYALAASDEVLHKVFTKIFEQSKQPDMLPLTENAFMIDPSIREITIIANKKTAQSKIYLQTPNGERINAAVKAANMKWFVSDSFDMITLTRPQHGEWKILFSDDDNRAYIVADIKLRSHFEYDTEKTGQELIIKAWFEKDNQVITQAELLSNIESVLEIEHPDGKLENKTIESANAEGLFVTRFTPTMNGIYAATLTAKSATFQRQQIFSFRASIPEAPVEPQPQAVAEPEIAAEPEVAAEQEVAAEPEPAAETPATPPTEEEKEEDDLFMSSMIFIGVNLVLLFIGINLYFYVKMRRRET